MTFREIQLQEILDIQWGDTKTTKASYVTEGYLAYSASGPDGFLEKYDYDEEGIVLSAIGANCGSTFYASGRWSCIKNTIRIFPKSDAVDLKYFFYMTKAPEFWPIRGSAQPFISQTDIRELYVQIPELPVQKVIGKILFELDEKIASNNALSKTLEKIAQTIFKSWFIDFDPVKAKMAGDTPTGMDAATAALFPDSLVESELGLIPKGWRAGSLGEIADLQGGFAFKSSSWTEIGVPVIKIGSVKPGFVDLTQVSYVDDSTAAAIPDDYRIPAGSMVVGLTGYVGQVGLVRTHHPIPLVNQRVAKFKPKSGEWKIPFIYGFTRGEKFKKIVEELSTGTAQQNVSNSQILSIPLALPSEAIRATFDDYFKSFFQQIINLADENESLKSIRDALLPRLISGELQIPEEMLAS
jgi:type I restriction enzyme S subunit